MVRRLIRWMLVALTAAFLAHMLLKAGARRDGLVQAGPPHSEPMAAMPWAPADQASSRSPGFIPPIA